MKRLMIRNWNVEVDRERRSEVVRGLKEGQFQ